MEFRDSFVDACLPACLPDYLPALQVAADAKLKETKKADELAKAAKAKVTQIGLLLL